MLVIIGLIAGVVIGLVWSPELPLVIQPYLPIMIVAAFDAIIGGFRAYLTDTFTDRVFLVSFVSNIAIAGLMVWIGDLIGVGSQLSTAIIVVLGIRIFTNLASIRRLVFHA